MQTTTVKQPSKEAHHLLGNVIDSDDEQVQAVSRSSRIEPLC